MKIPKHFLGRLVELSWKDPAEVRHECKLPQRADLPKGRAALATWKERGVIDDVTEGVVRLIYSEGTDPGASDTDVFGCQWIPEELIETVQVYEPTRVEGVP